MSLLRNGDPFPHLDVKTVGGQTLRLPDDLLGQYGVVLLYRGSWCPYCNAQLASFSRATDRLADSNIAVASISVDDEATSAELVAKHKIAFPVGHSADATEIARLTGAVTNDDPHYLQSTGFVLAPDGSLLTGVYSTGAIGRLTVDDVIGFVKYVAGQG